MKAPALLFASNMFGHLKADIIERIEVYLDNPTIEGWEDIKGLIISPKKFKSIWEAIIDIDSTFPQKGRTIDEYGNIIKEWAKIPTPEQVKQAIAATVLTNTLQNN